MGNTFSFRPRKGEEDLEAWLSSHRQAGDLRDTMAKAFRHYLMTAEKSSVDGPQSPNPAGAVDLPTVIQALHEVVPTLAHQVALELQGYFPRGGPQVVPDQTGCANATEELAAKFARSSYLDDEDDD